MRCIVPDCLGPARQRHHIFYEQALRRRWLEEPSIRIEWPSVARLLRDPRNLADICRDHHGRHHDGTPWRLELVWLPDECLEFGAAAFGAYAYDYLHRRYGGEDSRLESLLHAAA